MLLKKLKQINSILLLKNQVHSYRGPHAPLKQ